jgi:hypothetical protein
VMKATKSHTRRIGTGSASFKPQTKTMRQERVHATCIIKKFFPTLIFSGHPP